MSIQQKRPFQVAQILFDKTKKLNQISGTISYMSKKEVISLVDAIAKQKSDKYTLLISKV